MADKLGFTTDDILKELDLDININNETKKVPKPIQKDKKDRKKSELPSKTQIDQWYSHIESLLIEVYYIETNIPPTCPYCESWMQNLLERKYFKKLHELLNLNVNKVKYREIPCDWNCLHTLFYKEKGSKKEIGTPTEIDLRGEEWLIAYGRDIEYFPALRIEVKSNKVLHKSKKKTQIIQAVGELIEKDQTYVFNDKIYVVRKKVDNVCLLKPLLRYLKNLNLEEAEFPTHEKYSLFLGQYHRHISN